MDNTLKDTKSWISLACKNWQNSPPPNVESKNVLEIPRMKPGVVVMQTKHDTFYTFL